MCGIAGILRCDDRAVDGEILRQMCKAMRHRGPDEEGFYLDGSSGLAMCRLAIIDLKGGQQPISNEDQTAWIVFNGEIYNYRELRKRLEKLGHTFRTNSDTETILHAYEQYGADCPQHLNGMFAFAIWDKRSRELFCARDRVGKKPLLYALVGRQFIFASEFCALLLHPDVGRDVAPEAIHHYLSFTYVPSPLTAYRAIRKLDPGHTLKFTKEGRIETTRYWQPDFSRKTKLNREEAGERAIELLRDAVRVRLLSEVPLGAFLSGGIDSSAVVALMSELSTAPVKTFSIGFDEQDFSELQHARRIANLVGADHHEFVVRPDVLEVLPTLVEHYGEPYADSSAVLAYYVSRESRRFVTVALNGDGGDECFGGYERYVGMRLAEAYRKLPDFISKQVLLKTIERLPVQGRGRWNRTARARRFLRGASLPVAERYSQWLSVFDATAKGELYSDEFRRQALGHETIDILAPWFAQANRLGTVDASLFVDLMTYLPNDLLVKIDIASMAVSLEARSPFLDHRVIEFAASLPENFKVRGLTKKYLLKRALKNFVPLENLNRRKMGFCVPIGEWLRGPMQSLARGTLLSEKALRRGLFRRARLEQMIGEHTSGRRDHAQQLWTLMMLELWFNRFID